MVRYTDPSPRLVWSQMQSLRADVSIASALACKTLRDPRVGGERGVLLKAMVGHRPLTLKMSSLATL